MQRDTFLKLAAALATGLLLNATAHAQTTPINVAVLADFTGPYANIMRPWQESRLAVIDWWNKEVGSKLKVQIVTKTFDTHYDVAQTASLWPGIKAEVKPVLVLGVGGADAAALQQRLPEDKIPMLMGSASYGYGWKPNLWTYNIRPTYSHEAAAFLEWLRTAKLEGKRPVKFAVVASESTPAYADLAKGLQSYAKANPDKATLVETIWTEVQPTDMTLAVRRVVNAGADVIVVQANTAQAVAAKRALQALGKSIPIMLSIHNGLAPSSKSLGDPNGFAGDFEVAAMAVATEDDTSARKFYRMLQEKYGLKSGWNALSIIGLSQGIVTVRAIEATVKAKGAGNVTGEAVRETLLATHFTSDDLMGMLPGVDFSNEAPFPTGTTKVNIGTMKDGKVYRAASDVIVPTLLKW